MDTDTTVLVIEMLLGGRNDVFCKLDRSIADLLNEGKSTNQCQIYRLTPCALNFQRSPGIQRGGGNGLSPALLKRTLSWFANLGSMLAICREFVYDSADATSFHHVVLDNVKNIVQKLLTSTEESLRLFESQQLGSSKPVSITSEGLESEPGFMSSKTWNATLQPDQSPPPTLLRLLVSCRKWEGLYRHVTGVVISIYSVLLDQRRNAKTKRYPDTMQHQQQHYTPNWNPTHDPKQQHNLLHNELFAETNDDDDDTMVSELRIKLILRGIAEDVASTVRAGDLIHMPQDFFQPTGTTGRNNSSAEASTDVGVPIATPSIGQKSAASNPEEFTSNPTVTPESKTAHRENRNPNANLRMDDGIQKFVASSSAENEVPAKSIQPPPPPPPSTATTTTSSSSSNSSSNSDSSSTSSTGTPGMGLHLGLSTHHSTYSASVRRHHLLHSEFYYWCRQVQPMIIESYLLHLLHSTWSTNQYAFDAPAINASLSTRTTGRAGTSNGTKLRPSSRNTLLSNGSSYPQSLFSSSASSASSSLLNLHGVRIEAAIVAKIQRIQYTFQHKPAPHGRNSLPATSAVQRRKLYGELQKLYHLYELVNLARTTTTTTTTISSSSSGTVAVYEVPSMLQAIAVDGYHAAKDVAILQHPEANTHLHKRYTPSRLTGRIRQCTKNIIDSSLPYATTPAVKAPAVTTAVKAVATASLFARRSAEAALNASNDPVVSYLLTGHSVKRVGIVQSSSSSSSSSGSRPHLGMNAAVANDAEEEEEEEEHEATTAVTTSNNRLLYQNIMRILPEPPFVLKRKESERQSLNASSSGRSSVTSTPPASIMTHGVNRINSSDFELCCWPHVVRYSPARVKFDLTVQQSMRWQFQQARMDAAAFIIQQQQLLRHVRYSIRDIFFLGEANYFNVIRQELCSAWGSVDNNDGVTNHNSLLEFSDYQAGLLGNSIAQAMLEEAPKNSVRHIVVSFQSISKRVRKPAASLVTEHQSPPPLPLQSTGVRDQMMCVFAKLQKQMTSDGKVDIPVPTSITPTIASTASDAGTLIDPRLQHIVSCFCGIEVDVLFPWPWTMVFGAFGKGKKREVKAKALTTGTDAEALCEILRFLLLLMCTRWIGEFWWLSFSYDAKSKQGANTTNTSSSRSSVDQDSRSDSRRNLSRKPINRERISNRRGTQRISPSKLKLANSMRACHVGFYSWSHCISTISNVFMSQIHRCLWSQFDHAVQTYEMHGFSLQDIVAFLAITVANVGDLLHICRQHILEIIALGLVAIQQHKQAITIMHEHQPPPQQPQPKRREGDEDEGEGGDEDQGEGVVEVEEEVITAFQRVECAYQVVMTAIDQFRLSIAVKLSQQSQEQMNSSSVGNGVLTSTVLKELYSHLKR